MPSAYLVELPAPRWWQVMGLCLTTGFPAGLELLWLDCWSLHSDDLSPQGSVWLSCSRQDGGHGAPCRSGASLVEQRDPRSWRSWSVGLVYPRDFLQVRCSPACPGNYRAAWLPGLEGTQPGYALDNPSLWCPLHTCLNYQLQDGDGSWDQS